MKFYLKNWGATKDVRQIDLVREFLLALSEDKFATVKEMSEATGLDIKLCSSYINQLKWPKFGSWKVIRRTRDSADNIRVYEYRITERDSVYDDAVTVNLDEQDLPPPEDEKTREHVKPDDRRFNLKELSEITGTSDRCISEWIKQGYLHRPNCEGQYDKNKPNPNLSDHHVTLKWRRFDRTHIRRIKQIQRFKSAGISAEIAASFMDKDEVPRFSVQTKVEHIANSLPCRSECHKRKIVKRIMHLFALAEQEKHQKYDKSFIVPGLEIAESSLVRIRVPEEYLNQRFELQDISKITGVPTVTLSKWNQAGILLPPLPRPIGINQDSIAKKVYDCLCQSPKKRADILNAFQNISVSGIDSALNDLLERGCTTHNGNLSYRTYSAVPRDDMGYTYTQVYNTEHLRQVMKIDKVRKCRFSKRPGVTVKIVLQYLEQSLPGDHFHARIRACLHDVQFDQRQHLLGVIGRFADLGLKFLKKVECYYDPEQFIPPEQRKILSLFTMPEPQAILDSQSKYNEYCSREEENEDDADYWDGTALG